MLLRILLLLAAYRATENNKKHQDFDWNGCLHWTVGLTAAFGVCCAGYYAWESMKKAQNNYNEFQPQNNIVPASCDFIYQNSQVCLKIAAVGTGYAMRDVFKCFPSMISKVRACLDRNNYATGITADCTEDDLKKIKEQNQEIMDLINSKTNLQPFYSRRYPTGLKILPNQLGYTFKNPTTDSKSGCFDMTQTPAFSTGYCGKNAEIQLLPLGGHGGFWDWEGTGWEISFPLLEKHKPMLAKMTIKKEMTNWANYFMDNSGLNLFKRRSYSIFFNGNKIAHMEAQYLDGKKWYSICKERAGRGTEYLSWSNKCDINSLFGYNWTGYVDVPVRVEILARTPQGPTSFRSQSQFKDGLFTSSASSGVFQCHDDYSGPWYNRNVYQGCDLVLKSNKGFDYESFIHPLHAKVDVHDHVGADPVAVMNLQLSEYLTSKIKEDWSSSNRRDYKAYEDRLDRERKERERKEEEQQQRKRERENRQQQRQKSKGTQSKTYQNNQDYHPKKRGPIEMTQAEKDYVKNQQQRQKNY